MVVEDDLTAAPGGKSMTEAEHSAATIVGWAVPSVHSSMFPPDGYTAEGRSVLFQWDLRDARERPTHFRLTVKRQLVGQSVAAAIAGSDVAFEVLIEHVQFFVMNMSQLRGRSAAYVWQVTGLTGAGGRSVDVVASGVRTFRLPSPGEFSRFVAGVDPDAREPAKQAPVRPAAPSKGPAVGPASLACPNGDLETGTLTGWQARYGSRLGSSTINLNSLSLGIINGRHTIRSLADGFDPVLAPYGVNLPQVGEGSYSLRLGNSNTNGEADLISYTFTVNPQNRIFTFRYAVVLENPGDHSADQQPFFGYYIVRGPSIFWSFSPPWAYNHMVTNGFVVADSSNPFFKSVGGKVYREWTPVCADLSMYLGETMTIVFYTADCSASQHFGYAYIDGLCLSNEAVAAFAMPKEICASATLLADGSASTSETSCFWSIEESDANWGRNPATEVYEWFVAQQAGQIDLTAFYASKGGHFKCNTYYRIKLAVSNNCTPWNETVQLLHVTCPVVTAGPDACVSCVPNGQFTHLGVGNPSGPGFTYIWSPATGLNNPASPSPLHTQGSVAYPITYTVQVTDAKGCSNSDRVTLYCKKPAVEIGVVVECCKVTLTAYATDAANIEWSTGQSGTVIEVVHSGTYTVTVSNPCGSASASVVVPATSGLTGDFSPIAAESMFSPPSGSSSPPMSDVMHIKDVLAGSPAGIAGVPNSYNATDYKLEIFDRWGNLFKTVTGHSCDGFTNWSIAWDGTDDQGTLVQQDTYVWMLHFKNCQHKEWTPAKQRKFKSTCIRWATLFGVKLWCREWQTDIVDEVAPGSVTVVR
jgi:hypothetical protein